MAARTGLIGGSLAVTKAAAGDAPFSGDEFLERELRITLFSSWSALSKQDRLVTLRHLVEMIRTARARTKDNLPWVKLARFGDLRTDKNCLRHDDNVLAITGIEADYDGEIFIPEYAIEKLTQAGLLSIVYTSPSHTAHKPRWRVLCPTSKEYPPQTRSAFLGRLNGLFGGTFSGESWTLSQSYYYGAVGAGTAHAVAAIEGEPIDTLDELDEIWTGKPDTGSTAGSDAHLREQTRSGAVDEAALLDALVHGDDYHQGTIRIVGLWARRGMAMLDAEQRLLATFDDVFPDVRDARWAERRADVPRCIDWVYGREARSRDQSKSQSGPGGTRNKGETSGKTAEAYRPLSIVHPPSLAGLPVPARVWLVEDWLPVGSVTLLYSDGGTGKTLLVQQLATSLAAGQPWIGLPITPCRVFALFCEDDEAEVHRRQARINATYGVEYGDLEDFAYACPVGDDNVLVRFEHDGSWTPTPRYAELVQQVMAHEAKLLIVDTAADTFGGNENDRAQVRAYLGALLTRLARDADCAVLLNAHPSRAGMIAGSSMDSGSTAWSNTARSRWALVVPREEDGTIPDADLRLLTRRKSNYARAGEEIELRYQQGVLVPANPKAPSPFERVTKIMRAGTTFLALLDRLAQKNVFVSASKNASNYAPKLFAKQPDRDGCTRGDFEAALHDLLAADKLTTVPYGRKGDERYRLARPTPAQAGEEAIDPVVSEWRNACRDAGFPSPTKEAEPQAESVRQSANPPKKTRARKPAQSETESIPT